MKKVLLVCFLVLLYFNSYAYDRLSIVERFTNSSCGPCATVNNAWYNATTQSLINSGAIAHIVYNGWWPGPNDPMYLLNQADNTARINYYGVNAVPWIVVNGTTISTDQAALENAVTNGNSQYSPFQILVNIDEFSQNLIQYTVTITRDPEDNTNFGNNVRLQFGLTEKSITYSPPQPNGESVFFSICRKMLPDAGGTLFTIPSPGQSTEVTLQYTPTSQFLAQVNLDSIRVVAFIQDNNNKYIYQSFMGINYGATINSTSHDIIGSNSDPAEFTTSILNSGLMSDTYNVQVSLNGPSEWSGEFTTPNGTFTFDQSDQIQVPSGNSTEISITANPNGVNGFGEITAQFTSVNNPDLVVTSKMRLVTSTGINGLAIDASGNGYGDVVMPAFDQEFQYPHGIVSSNALYPGIDLTHLSIIIWSTGNKLPVFNQDEINALIPFLDNGGNLFISGQDIGSDIFEPTGQSQFAQEFYHNYLHANYVSNSSNIFLLKGVSGDVIGDGLIFNPGTIYPRSLDIISRYDSYADSSFIFLNGPTVSGIRSDNNTSRVVYLGFGIEQISDAAKRDTILARSIAWLTENVVISNTNNINQIPFSFNLDQNYPNPFNPTTKISYSIPKSSVTTLKVFDILGNEITTLVNGEKLAGKYEVDFNAAKLSSGVYFYQLQSGGIIQTKKMVILK